MLRKLLKSFYTPQGNDIYIKTILSLFAQKNLTLSL